MSQDTSYLLYSATTILLRCTVECTNLEVKRHCAQTLEKLIRRLQLARKDSAWDLADACLERCKDPIERIAAGLECTHHREDYPPTTGLASDGAPLNDQIPGVVLGNIASEDDFLLPNVIMSFPWDTDWEDFIGSWPSFT